MNCPHTQETKLKHVQIYCTVVQLRSVLRRHLAFVLLALMQTYS